MPMILVIDTTNQQYYFQLKGIAKANLIKDDKEIFAVRLRVFFFKFMFYPLKKDKVNKPAKKISTTTKVRNKTTVKSFKTVIRVMKSFKVKRFYLNLDTGDCITNSKLYPVFSLLNYYLGGFYINYTGRNTLVLAIQNRPIRIIKSYFNI